MRSGKLKLNVEMDLDEIFTPQDYEYTLEQQVKDIFREELTTAVRKAAKAHMRDFAEKYMEGKCKIVKDEKGRDVVLVPLLVEDLR